MICSKCKGDFPATAEFFSPLKNRRGRGFDYWCRACKNASKRRYRRGIRAPERKFARRVAYEMYAPEFLGRCLKDCGTDHPCRNRATWQALDPGSEWRACDAHRLKSDVPVHEETP